MERESFLRRKEIKTNKCRSNDTDISLALCIGVPLKDIFSYFILLKWFVQFAV